jgi:DNA-directed RNA polymerase subunit RPC12/RpoP
MFKCNDPHCTHFAPKHAIVGKASRCTQCGTEFVLTPEDLKRAEPRCVECSETKKAKNVKRIKDNVKELFKEHEEVENESMEIL